VCREEQRQVLKRKKRRAKGPSRLSFADEVDADTDEDDSEAAGKFTLIVILPSQHRCGVLSAIS